MACFGALEPYITRLSPCVAHSEGVPNHKTKCETSIVFMAATGSVTHSIRVKALVVFRLSTELIVRLVIQKPF